MNTRVVPLTLTSRPRSTRGRHCFIGRGILFPTLADSRGASALGDPTSRHTLPGEMHELAITQSVADMVVDRMAGGGSPPSATGRGTLRCGAANARRGRPGDRQQA